MGAHPGPQGQVTSPYFGGDRKAGVFVALRQEGAVESTLCHLSVLGDIVRLLTKRTTGEQERKIEKQFSTIQENRREKQFSTNQENRREKIV